MAYLGFQLFSPSQLLRPYIKSFWYLQRANPLPTLHKEFMHPSGGYSIVFNLGDKLLLDEQPIPEKIFLDGANTVSRKMGFSGYVEVLGIRFQVGGAYPFLRVPLNELRNQPTFLDALPQPGLQELQERIQEAKTLPARIALLEEWLLNRLRIGQEPSDIIPASLALLLKGGWQKPMPELMQELPISQRQLERLYQAQVGMSPKQFTKLLRVEKARLAIKQLKDQSLTRVGADLGYFDQSHFIREFKSVIQMTPHEYLKRNFRIPQEYVKAGKSFK